MSIPLNTYGSLEDSIRAIRAGRPLDLSAGRWTDLAAWQKQARECVSHELGYDPAPAALQPSTLQVIEREDFTQELVAFNTTPWFRVEGWFLLPRNRPRPLPAILLLHEWGGPMTFGKDRVANCGRDCEILRLYRQDIYDSAYLAEVFCRAGYAVLCIDAYHFGARIPRAINGIPADFDPWTCMQSLDGLNAYHAIYPRLIDALYLGVRQLNWAGTTWAGINYWDDARSVDYLLSRPEIDPARIGVTGLSGGGYRTNLMLALNQHIRAGVSVGWMTTGDEQQKYNVAGAIGTFCLLPGLWRRLDIPDLIGMAFPKKALVIIGSHDILFPDEGVDDAFRQIGQTFLRAGCADHVAFARPDTPHCYNTECQQLALDWFARSL